MKIFVRMRGGLGNQMFQYAYARALQENNANGNVVLDTREYKNYNVRDFELDRFILKKDVEISSEAVLPYDFHIKAYRLYQFLYFKITKRRLKGYLRNFENKGYIFSGRSCQLPNDKFLKNVYLYGYFQSSNPILKLREILFNEFEVSKKSDEVKKIISNIKDNTVAVSIRCGEDYRNGGWPIQNKEYYLNGLKELECDENRKILVFADDIETVIEEKWFEDYKNVEYIKNFSPTEQIGIMKQCKYFVISNSSFAWWGSFLGTCRGGTVMAPEFWYNDVKTVETPLLFPEMKIMQ